MKVPCSSEIVQSADPPLKS
uniref:Uncharacterized protein n=1 Tax=Arundo donax TaxID=35708 RepID=A0A0A9HMY9_ARUDO